MMKKMNKKRMKTIKNGSAIQNMDKTQNSSLISICVRLFFLFDFGSFAV